MLDIKYLRDNPDQAKAALARVGDHDSVDTLLALDARRRELVGKLEKLRSERNAVSKEIGKMKDAAAREEKIAAMKALGEDLKSLEAETAAVESELEECKLSIPNLPDPAVPDGRDDSENIVQDTVGDLPAFDFTPRPHWELGEASGLIDFERGVKVAGTRFYVLRDDYARLQRALISFMLDVHTREHGFSEVYPPYMVRQYCMVGTGQLPKFGENSYHDAEEDFWFIPTAEVPVTNLYRDEILDNDLLPVKHVAYTACFRREKMSAGKDTRGIKRGHQFDKVEMVALTRPEESAAMLDTLIKNACRVLEKLELPYRKVQMCTGDLSFTAAAKYDLEVWAAGCGEWLEVSSLSNFHDFQARRANIRFRRKAGEKPEFVHTLNGSGLALPRVLIAILENGQTAEGRVRLPAALQPYLGGQEVIG